MSTETRNPLSTNFDALDTLDMVRLMNREDARVPLAVAEVLPQIAQTVDLMTNALRSGNRVFYTGAGTSGRLAVLDAVELLPTFSLEPDRVVPLLAGGDRAMMNSIEGAEDDAAQGQRELEEKSFGKKDLLVAVAASGRTPYALGGLRHASAVGAASAAIVCNRNSPMADAARVAIEVVVGPEVLTGSTRLKAGTAQKLVLNMLSTCTMARLGKVYGNLMIDVQPSNEKLVDRAVRIIAEITDLDYAASQQLLDRAGGRVKTALLMALSDADFDQAQARLDQVNGHLRKALEQRTINS